MRNRIVPFLLDNLIWILLVVVIVAFSIMTNRYLTTDNLVGNILVNAAVLGVLVIGQSFTLVTGNFDLSMESTVGIAALLGAWLVAPAGAANGSGVSANIVVSVIAMLAIGLAVGWVNGNLITRLKMNNFITTLAMLIVLRGLVLVTSNGHTISRLPATFVGIGQAQVGFLPILVIVLLVAFIFAQFVMKMTVFGRDLYAVGGSASAALATGIDPRRRVRQVYLISGVLAAFGGWMMSARLGVAVPRLGQGMVLQVFAAAVIGGISLSGGRGSMLGALGGVLLISAIDSGLNLMRVSSFWIQTVRGLVILFAMFIDAQKMRFSKPELSSGSLDRGTAVEVEPSNGGAVEK